MKQVLVASLVSLAVIAALGFTKFLQIKNAIAEGAKHAPPPDAVTVISVAPTTWPKVLTATGSVRASQGVTIGTELAGKVVKIGFESGQAVKQGDVLIELDTSVEQAELAGLQATAEQAKKALARAEALRTRNANSIADLENAQARAREADAAVASLRATIGRKRVTAPFSGRAGIRTVNVGEYVSGGTALVPLFALDPVYVNFNLPQNAVGEARHGQTVKISVDGFPDRTFEGKVTALNPQVDSSTRNVEIQATFANPDEALRPGMFASVTLYLDETLNVIPVPGSGIAYAPYGDAVYVVETKKGDDGNEQTVVRQQIVKLGVRRGDQVAVMSGLKPGDKVVTSGVFKLRPDAPVNVVDGFEVGNDVSPTPADT